MSRPAHIFGLVLVLSAADHPRSTAAVYFNLRPEQATAQCLSRCIRAFLAMAGAFAHSLGVYSAGVSPDELLVLVKN